MNCQKASELCITNVCLKEEHDGTKMYKARLVVKRFQQREDIDFTEIFSPIVKLITIRSVLSIVAADIYI